MGQSEYQVFITDHLYVCIFFLICEEKIDWPRSITARKVRNMGLTPDSCKYFSL
jgi:hypothetical protein